MAVVPFLGKVDVALTFLFCVCVCLYVSLALAMAFIFIYFNISGALNGAHKKPIVPFQQFSGCTFWPFASIYIFNGIIRMYCIYSESCRIADADIIIIRMGIMLKLTPILAAQWLVFGICANAQSDGKCSDDVISFWNLLNLFVCSGSVHLLVVVVVVVVSLWPKYFRMLNEQWYASLDENRTN